MKKVLSSILISFIIFTNLFAPFSVGFDKKGVEVNKNEVEAVEACVIENFSFSPKGGPNEAFPDTVSLSLNTQNCIGKRVIIALYELSGWTKETVYNVSKNDNYKLLENNFVINLAPTEKSCTDGKCRIEFYVALQDIDSGYQYASYSSKDSATEKELDYNCKTNTCKENDANWVKSTTTSNQSFQSDTATIWRDFAVTENSIIVSGGEQITGPDLKILKDKIDPQDSIGITIYNADGTPVNKEILGENNPIVINGNLLFNDKGTFSYKKELAGLAPETSYTVSIKPNFKNYPYLNTENKTVDIFTRNKEGQIVVQTPGKATSDSQEIVLPNNELNMPACSLAPSTWYTGCVGRLLYYAVFVPTSYLFALSGIFFDTTFAYSVQDISYRSSFVVEGWGLVRDFCNLFFIFVLLYVAIGTILDFHNFNSKGIIKNVIIIGLLINFSLFATQVIIDASNVTARVFYNADAIKISQDSNTGASDWVAKADENGVLPMSAAIVNKVNPQNIVLQYQKINDIQVKGGSNVTGKTESNGISAGAFIVIVIMASAVNIIGFIVFLSIGLIFVSRVVGLWVAMIIAPLAFFTYIIPSFAKTKMIGWENWWPDTLKLAFLAPVFMFFMYIILKFLELDIISDSTKNQDGLYFFISILIPFAFIVILLLKAKSIASDMSGEMGRQITGGVAAAGGALLGGAALGTAFLGRKGIGAGIAKLSRTEGAKELSGHKINFNKELDNWKSHGGIGPKPTWSNYKQQNQISDNKNPISWLGAKLNEKQAKVNMLDHATHDIEEAKKTAHIVDSKGEALDDINMSGEDEKELEKAFNKNKRSDVETNLRKGLDASGKNPATIAGHEGEEAYRRAERGNVEAAYMRNNNIASVNDLTDRDKKNIENDLNKKFNVDLSAATKTELEGFFKHIRDESRQGVSMLTRGFARSNRASYDIRNLSDIKAGKKDSFMSKIPTALISGVALGVRAGLKNSGVNHGKGEADFMKDLGSTLTEALKSVKIEVPKAASGGGHGGGDAHGGGHGGGGHH